MNIRCLFGLHDWDEFGECRRDFMHVQSRPYDFQLYSGPYSRVMYQRYQAKRRAGAELQAQLAALGETASLEMCSEVARDPALVASILEVARERHDR